MDKRVVRIARVGSPVTYALALLLFLMPFLSVSCDAPEGYGRTTAGGTTSYTGPAHHDECAEPQRHKKRC